MFLSKQVSARPRGLSFNSSLTSLVAQLTSIEVTIHSTQLDLGSFLSKQPIFALLPVSQPKNVYCSEVIEPCDKWLSTVGRFPLRESKIADLVSLCYPDVNEARLLAALVNISGLFVYDDYIDKLPADGSGLIALDQAQANMHTAFSNPQTYMKMPNSDTPGFVRMVSEMGDYLLKSVPEGISLEAVHAAFSGYLDAMLDETNIRSAFVNAYSTGDMQAVLDINERHFLKLRSRSSGVEFVFSLCAAFDGFSLMKSGVRASYVVDNVISSCGDAIGVFNDIVTLRKDLLEALTENLVLIVAEKAFFSKNPTLSQLAPEDLRECLFYRDLCIIKGLNEREGTLLKAVGAVQQKYKMSLLSGNLEILLHRNLDSFLTSIDSIMNPKGISFKETIFETWKNTLDTAIHDTLHEYFNKEVVSFYSSIHTCQQAALISPVRFTPELFRYFRRLETWLSGSSWWSIDPENKRYNWWRS